tara:strand:+ start:9 stop:1751 length:1743 start_codon:yes stop_codon:yes gene_type:complete
MDGLSDEKRRLEQYLLQTRASNIFSAPIQRKVNPAVKAQINRFQVDAGPIERIKLVESQILAGKVPVSDALKKAQKKRKKKAKKSKKLRGEVGRNIKEQRRFEKGERREKDGDEPRIVGDPDPDAGGLAYDVGVETRRLDLAQAIEDQRRLEAIADRAERRRDRGDDAVFRRLELQARRAGGGGRGGGGDADPIPEIIRLGERIRGDYNAFGDEQERRNREVLGEFRAVSDAENRERQGQLEGIAARQQAQDENLRAANTRQDALFQELHARFDFHEERALSQTRKEIAAAEERLRGASRQLDRPTSYDEVLLDASQKRQTAAELRRSRLRGSARSSPESPTERLTLEQSTPEPEEPERTVVSGGGELEVPDITLAADPIEPATPQTPERPAEPERPKPRSSKARASGGSRSPLVGGGAGQTADERLQTLLGTKLPVTSPRKKIAPVITAASVIEGDEAKTAARLRLTDTQDFASGFERQIAESEFAGGATPSPVISSPIEEGFSGTHRLRTTPAREAAAQRAATVAGDAPDLRAGITSESPPDLRAPGGGLVEQGTPSSPAEEALLEEVRAGSVSDDED